MKYIATFFSHFGAIRFDRLCRQSNIVSRVMPVPRSLSSSCGSCVSYEACNEWPENAVESEVEQIVEVSPAGYRTVFDNR